MESHDWVRSSLETDLGVPKFYRQMEVQHSMGTSKHSGAYYFTSLWSDNVTVMMSARPFYSLFAPWTCRACLKRTTRTSSRFTYATQTSKQALRRKRRSKLLLASMTGTGIAATAVAFNDEARYVAQAAQRSGRVVTTLFICINEYIQSARIIRS